LLEFGANAFEKDLIDPFRVSALDGTLNLLNRAFYLPAITLDALDITGDNSMGSYSMTLSGEASTGVDANVGPLFAGANANIGAEVGFSFDSEGNLFYTTPGKWGGYAGVSGEVGIEAKRKFDIEGMRLFDLIENASLAFGITANHSETANADQILSGVALERNRSINLQSGGVHGASFTRVEGLTTSLKIPEANQDQWFTQDLDQAALDVLSGQALHDQSGVHKYSGIGAAYTVSRGGPSVSYEDGVNITMQYGLSQVTNNHQNIVKTAYGLLYGLNYLHETQSEILTNVTQYTVESVTESLLMQKKISEWWKK